MRKWLLVLVVNSCHLIFKSLSLCREKSSPATPHPEKVQALHIIPFVLSIRASLSAHLIRLHQIEYEWFQWGNWKCCHLLWLLTFCVWPLSAAMQYKKWSDENIDWAQANHVLPRLPLTHCNKYGPSSFEHGADFWDCRAQGCRQTTPDIGSVVWGKTKIWKI